MLFVLAVVAAAPAALVPTYLRADHAVNPLGIDDATPSLSWVDVSGTRGSSQTAYRITVASSEQKLKAGTYDLWDSGKTIGDAESIEYAGSPIAAGKGAWWKVWTWSATDDDPSGSKIGHWEVGLPDKSQWTAQWISNPSTEHLEYPRPAPFFRKDFSTKKEVVSARAYVSAKGLYQFFIDGHPIGTDCLAPGWTDYDKRVQYQTFDVTSMLKKGAHTLGLTLGDGWFCGHVGWTPGNNYGKKPYGLVQFDLTYRDGSTERIATDSTWKIATGPIASDDLLMGESYDARKEIKNWNLPGLNAESWPNAEATPIGSEALVAQVSPPVRRLAELKSLKITTPAPKTYVFDLGQNMVGWTRLKVNGPAGTQVQLRFAEMLNPDGTIYVTNLRGAKATDLYTLKGKGRETFEPAFTFHGFRYVEVTGFPGVPSKDAITGVVAGSDVPQTGWFSCSSPSINQLQHNIYWGQRGNYVSIPTDCPQRDERLGWMGDAQIFVRTATFNNDVEAFHTKWTQDVVDAQSEDGAFPDVSPRKGDLTDGAPAWGDAGVIVPWTIYRAYDDKRILADRYPAMKKWISYIDSANPNHLWIEHSNNNFGDWLNVGDDTPREVLATAYFAHSTDLVAKTAEVLGKTDEAAKYRDLFEAIKAAFLSNYVDAEGKIKGDSQTDYLMALNFELLPQSLRAKATQRLVDHIVIDRKTHLSTGFVGSGLLNPTLTANGQTDVAYKLLFTDTYPSWLYSVRQGATTIWERWDGWTKDKGFQDPGMNSFNHYSFGAVGQWMYATVGGVDFDQPGYKHIVIHPVPGGGLSWAKSALDSIRGRISCEWKQDAHSTTMNVEIPANTTATVYIPADKEDDVMEGSEVAAASDGVTFDHVEKGFVVYRVGGGTYRFVAKR